MPSYENARHRPCMVSCARDDRVHAAYRGDAMSEEPSMGALRAAYLIGAQSMGKPNHPIFWTEESYTSLAKLIDHETGAKEMHEALQFVDVFLEDHDGEWGELDTLKKVRAVLAKFAP